uniref:Centromere protein T n=2 Tax=Cairina moschata TaxID=8855 RepID=A0A8C3CR73_CAIMO
MLEGPVQAVLAPGEHRVHNGARQLLGSGRIRRRGPGSVGAASVAAGQGEPGSGSPGQRGHSQARLHSVHPRLCHVGEPRAGPGSPLLSEAVAFAGPGTGGVEQPVLLADLLTELGLGQAQAADAALHLLHLHLQQRDDVALLVELPQQLLRRGARRQRVRVVGGASFQRTFLPYPYRHRQPPGPGPGYHRRGPQLHLHRQVDGLHVLGRAPCRGLGGGAGALSGGGGRSGSSGGGGGGAGAACGPRRLALVDAAQGEDGGHPHQSRPGSGRDVAAAARRAPLRQQPAAFPDVDNDTPRVLLRRVIRNQPQVSPLAPPVADHKETEDAPSEPSSRRTSSMVELQLPDIVPEDTSISTFRMTRSRKKLSISQFERAADKRLPQNQAHSTLDSTLARSLRMSLGSVLAPDTVEKKGLLRRPKNRKAIDIAAFEGGVEQNMQRKAQNYLVDLQTASVIEAATATSDAEIMLNNTELFVQPQSVEQNQKKLSALEPQLSESKTPVQRSEISNATQEEGKLVGRVSSVGTDEGRTRRYSEEELINDGEHVDNMAHVSQKTSANQGEDEQGYSQQSEPMEQLSTSEEVAGTINRWSSSLPSRSSSRSPVILKPRRSFSMSLREVVSRIIEELDVSDKEEEMANAVNEVEQEEISREAMEHHTNAGYSEHLEKKLTEKAESQIIMSPEEEGVAEGSVKHQDSPKPEPEMARSARAGSLSRHSHAFSSFEKSGTKPSEEAVEQADELLEDGAVMGELDGSEEESTEDETEMEGQESEEGSMKTPTFVRAPAYHPLPLLSTPHSAKPAAPASPLQPQQAKPVPKTSRKSQKKKREPALASSYIKQIFRHYAKMPVTRDAYQIIEKCCEKYFKQLSDDLEAYAHHAGRKTVEMADLELLMRRQRLVTDKMPLRVLIERYLPMEYRKLLIPVAVSGNKVIPSKSMWSSGKW